MPCLPVPSGWVALGWIAAARMIWASGWVVLRLLLPEVVVTWFVTGFWTSNFQAQDRKS